jgi:AraC family transcriptional regulator of adaptative response/methylated-DNA-[protein]-cysteine methyltransferase
MNEYTAQTTLAYQRIEQAINYLDQNFQSQPSLDEIANSVHLSKYHFQRLFKQWAGVIPTQFMHFLTVDYAKERLSQAQSVFDTSLDAGLSSAGRLHDLFVTFEAVTPGEFKRRGAGVIIHYGFHPTQFGDCLLAQTSRGICALRFVAPGEREDSLIELKSEWPLANFVADQSRTQTTIDRLFTPAKWEQTQPFHLVIKGTNFQVKVWQALLSIPQGAMVSYGDLAAFMGRPTAVRATAGAVANNPIAYLIPCHRVISKAGNIHRYRWGAARKRAILGWEASRLQFPFPFEQAHS